MDYSYCFTLSLLELRVRSGDEQAQDLQAIGCYVHCGLQRAQSHHQLNDTRKGYLSIINTLIETMCDTNLSHMWRQQCHAYIRKLLPLLYEITTTQQYQNKVEEINALQQFFLSSKSPTSPTLNTKKLK